MRRVYRRSSLLVGSALVALASLAACGGGGDEQQTIKKYFDAARMRDSQTLNNIATVNFDPREDGSVQSFSVVTVSPETRRPLRLRELHKAHEDARAADEEFTKRKKAFQDMNLDAIDRVLKAERANTKPKGKDAEVQTAWSKWRDETREHAKQVNDARTALSSERGVAEISAFDARNPIDVTEYDGEHISKEVTIEASVKLPDGQSVEKNLVVTLERTLLKKEGKEVTGRWLVTQVKEAGAAPKTS